MLQLFLAMAVIAGTISLSIFKIDANINKQVQIHQEAKKLIEVDKKRVFSNRFSKNPITRRGSIQNIKLSELAITPTMQDSILLNKLQKATEVAVIDRHIDSPNCSQLASTGFISTGECTKIANKHQDYLKFDNSAVQLPQNSQNKKIVKNISNLQGNSIVANAQNNNSTISLTRTNTLLQNNQQANAEGNKALAIATQLIRETNSSDKIKTILQQAVKRVDSNPVETKKFLANVDSILQKKATDTTATDTTAADATNIQHFKDMRITVDATDKSIKEYTDKIHQITSKNILNDKPTLSSNDEHSINTMIKNTKTMRFDF